MDKYTFHIVLDPVSLPRTQRVRIVNKALDLGQVQHVLTIRIEVEGLNHLTVVLLITEIPTQRTDAPKVLLLILLFLE